MDDFNVWTEADWQKACKFGFTVVCGLVGGAFGGLASTPMGGVAAPVTVPAGAAYGAALGLAAGLLACPQVSKEKAERFLSGALMPRADAAQVLSALAHVSQARRKDDVLLLAAELQSARRSRKNSLSERRAKAPPTSTPASFAHLLLSWPRQQSA